VPWGVNRRRVVTLNDGEPGERSISVACMHCSDAPCVAVCPVDGCGYCFYACGPEKDNSKEEFAKYGSNRLAQGKLPACAEMCSTKALLGGDGDVIADIYR
jgi:formate dehydrogenase iron-sulfur subunit